MKNTILRKCQFVDLVTGENNATSSFSTLFSVSCFLCGVDSSLFKHRNSIFTAVKLVVKQNILKGRNVKGLSVEKLMTS
jgi:hypothetical protein